MFSHLFRHRLFLSALALSLIAVIGAYFGEKWYFGNFTYIRDSEGKLHLHKAHQPFVQVGAKKAFTPEQYKKLNLLRRNLLLAQAKGNTSEIQRLEAEIEQLRAESVGERPDVSVLILGYPGESLEEAMERMRQAGAEALKRAYREQGSKD